jgi:DNA-binding MarR family transcriptional regulator
VSASQLSFTVCTDTEPAPAAPGGWLDKQCHNMYRQFTMPGTSLQQELKQTRPFKSPQEEAHLNIVRTASMLTSHFEQFLKPHGITSTQYNVLRILRGTGTGGLCRNELGDRLITRMPDVTRLLDRMEEAGLVTRERQEADRRMVRTTLTRAGRKLVDDLDPLVEQEHARILGKLTRAQLKLLNELIALARAEI